MPAPQVQGQSHGVSICFQGFAQVTVGRKARGWAPNWKLSQGVSMGEPLFYVCFPFALGPSSAKWGWPNSPNVEGLRAYIEGPDMCPQIDLPAP